MENEQNLHNVIESILFVAGGAVDITDITSKLCVTKNQVEKAVEKLKEKYDGESGIKILAFNNKFQLSTNSSYATDVSVVLNPIRERQLTKATLETLSIIAYKQPVTRLEIEEVRGVSSDYAINILLEHNLIQIAGRKDAVGKPVLFATTDEFLKRFNLKSIDALPSYDDLISRIKTLRTTDRDESLYKSYDIPTDDIVPDHSAKEEQKEMKQIEDESNEFLSKINSVDDGDIV